MNAWLNKSYTETYDVTKKARPEKNNHELVLGTWDFAKSQDQRERLTTNLKGKPLERPITECTSLLWRQQAKELKGIDNPVS